MAHLILVHFLTLFLLCPVWAKLDVVNQESSLGEKNLVGYSGRYQPLVFQDIYQGKMNFEDDLFFQNFFAPYIFTDEFRYSTFLKSELNAGLTCPNEVLAKHFDYIRYAYRLITLSYLLEAQDHLKKVSEQFSYKNGCAFELTGWTKSCRAKSKDMKTFLERFRNFTPKYDDVLPPGYRFETWLAELKKHEMKWYSHYLFEEPCRNGCTTSEFEKSLNAACAENNSLLDLICSEEDELYGLASHREAYSLLASSNIVNTMNQRGEALGCLRRFSEILGHREPDYHQLKKLFLPLQTYLSQKYQERFIQGRAFFYGAAKEFDQKGVSAFVKPQPFQNLPAMKDEPVPEEKPAAKPADEPKKPVTVIAKVEPKKAVELPRTEPEIKKPVKSAFLQAAEARKSADLPRIDVDMLKLKYDYVFTLNMLSTLSKRLKTFMTREALIEMMNFDKLGTKEGPVPLMFLKYMIDMQEHQGMWNIISVLGERFYVSNEIDSAFKPEPELIQLSNNDATNRQWQITILKP